MKNVTAFATAMLLATIMGGCASASDAPEGTAPQTVAISAEDNVDPATKVQTDKVSCGGSETERATERPCNATELAIAVGHCHYQHGLEASQNIVGCLRRGNYIVYSFEP